MNTHKIDAIAAWRGKRMSLTMTQLLLLNNLIYVSGLKNGLTVGEASHQMLRSMTGKAGKEETVALLGALLRDPVLSSYQITYYVKDAGGMEVACFVDPVEDNPDVNVVFRGTGSDQEWRDNGEGAYLADTPAQIQAAAYVERLPREYGNRLTVTGHSKGGNKAQYVTIVTDRVSRCLSFDGQGFSPAFIDKYKAKIQAKSPWIVSVAAAHDYVNCLLYSIAATHIYIEDRPQENYLLYHEPYEVFSEAYHLLPDTEQADIPRMLHEYSIYLLNNLPMSRLKALMDELMNGIIMLQKTGKEINTSVMLQMLLSGITAVSSLQDQNISIR
jgi:hypothetical protein